MRGEITNSIAKLMVIAPSMLLLASGMASAQIKVDARLHTYSGSCSNCDLSNKDMTRMKLQNSDLSGSIFNRSNLSGGNFDNSNLSATHFKGEFHESIFNDSNLVSVSAEDADFSNSHFVNARADHINLEGANLTGTIFKDTKFGNALFERAVLKDADISGADLRDVTGLTQAQLDTACGNYKTRLPTGLSVAYCKHELDTFSKHAEDHRRGRGHPPHINRAAEDLDDALKSLELMLAKAEDRKTRRSLQAIHADVMAARDALER